MDFWQSRAMLKQLMIKLTVESRAGLICHAIWASGMTAKMLNGQIINPSNHIGHIQLST